MVNLDMYKEFHESLKYFYDSIGSQIPIMIKISGFIGIDQSSRQLAKLHREERFASVSACVTPSPLLRGAMILIYNAVGSKSLPRKFFTDGDKALEWLEKEHKELGKKSVSEKDVLEKVLSKQKSKSV